MRRKTEKSCHWSEKLIWGIAVVLCLIALLIPHHLRVRHSAKLIDAIKRDDIKAVKEILTRDPKCINCTPVWFPTIAYFLDVPIIDIYYPINAAAMQDLEMVQGLIEAGADPNEAVFTGYSPLHFTYYFKPDEWLKIADYLIENGADINYTDGDIACALSDIAGRQWPEHNETPEEKSMINSSFMEVYQICNHQSQNWKSVWFRCIRNNRIELMEQLLKDGYASINESGDLSLIHAVSGDCEPETVKWLIEHGSDPALIDKNGYTALDYAIERGYKELIPILEEALSTADDP